MALATRSDLEQYIRRAALQRGIDPTVALKVAQSEGLNADPNEGWQSNFVKNGVREPSFGPYQLYLGGGLGNEFQKRTGLDPRKPETVYQQIDFALDHAKDNGWTAWYGARNTGIGDWQGIKPGAGASGGVQVAQAGEFNPFSIGAMPLTEAAPSGGAQTPVADEFDPFKAGAQRIQDAATARTTTLAEPPAPVPMQAPSDYGQPPEGMAFDPATGQMYDASLRPQTEASRLRTFTGNVVEGAPIVGPALRSGIESIAASGRSALYGTDVAAERDSIRRMGEIDNATYPGTALAGSLTGSVLPMAALGGTQLGAQALGMTGKSLATRSLASAGSGAIISGADTAARGGDVGDIGQSALIGGALGGVLPAAGEGINFLGRTIRDTVGPRINALIRPEMEAGRRVGQAVQIDRANPGALTQADEASAALNNQPLLNVDRGGETTRALARSAANTDPEARGIIQRTVDDRFVGQFGRARDFVTRIMGGEVDDIALQERVRDAARRANKPAYDRAYNSPKAQAMWDEGYEQLMQAPAMQQAARDATTRGANRAAVEGFTPIRNPFVQDGDRLVLRTNADGSVAKPTLQFWDQVKRNLDDQIGAAQRAGEKSLSADLMALKTTLVQRLDETVPEFAKARAGAARFFEAEDAIEAGKKFVMQSKDIRQTAEVLKGMTLQERKAFAVGFSAELMERMGNVRDRANVVDRIFGNPTARQKIELALGKGRAKEFEQFARVETAMDQLRHAMGNSTTARQLAELGMAGSTALYTGDLTTGLVSGAMTRGARAIGAKIDERVMKRVAKLLVSKDPADIQKAISLASNNPRFAVAIEALNKGAGILTRATTLETTRE